jgi:hypothetical protein
VFFIVLRDRRSVVRPHIGAFIGREEATLRVFDPPFGNLLAVDRECARSTPASKPPALYG